MKLSVQIDGDLSKILEQEIKDTQNAVTTGVRKTGEGLKSELRAQVASAGLGRRLANAVRLNVYPDRGSSLSAAAWVYARPGKGGRGGAADIMSAFEEGSLIRRGGSQYLAIPTDHVPRKGGRRMTPNDLQSGTKFGGFGRDLEVVPTNRPGVLLLALPIVRANNGKSLRPATGRRIKAGKQVEWVPMFILVRQVQMPRLLDWRGPAESWGARLPDEVIRAMDAQNVSGNAQ
jgi:hypothetical protein